MRGRGAPLEATLSLAQRVEFEGEPVKGSRFIGIASPTRGAEEAQVLVSELWSLHPKARHVCWAYSGLGRDERRWVDDGEPSGTAGRPILQVIEGSGLSWVTVAIVRYFGGTKLGTGGLARAYAEATKAVIDHAKLVELTPKIDLDITLDYALERGAQHLLSTLEATVHEARYEAQVRLSVTIAATNADEAQRALVELSAGRALIERSEVYLGA